MNIRWLALPAALLCCQIAAAAQAFLPTETSQETPLPQVDIESQRAKLHAMEVQLYAFEDQFFGEYNKLNDIKAFDVHCGWEMLRQFRVHKCRPVFQEWAQRDSFINHLSGNTVWIGDIGNGDPNVVLCRTRDYQKHMEALVGKHPELLQVLKDRAELGVRYEALRNTFSWE